MCLFDAPDPTPLPPPKKQPQFLTGAADGDTTATKAKKTGIRSLKVDLAAPPTGSGLNI